MGVPLTSETVEKQITWMLPSGKPDDLNVPPDQTDTLHSISRECKCQICLPQGSCVPWEGPLGTPTVTVLLGVNVVTGKAGLYPEAMLTSLGKAPIQRALEGFPEEGHWLEQTTCCALWAWRRLLGKRSPKGRRVARQA